MDALLDGFRYVNNVGESIVFGVAPYYIMENDLRDFVYEVSTLNGLKYSRSESTKTVPVKLINATIEQKNDMYEVFQKDIMDNAYGTLWIGNYYYKCNVVASKKSNYTSSSELYIELKIYSKLSTWFCEETTAYTMKNTVSDGVYRKKYPYRYPYGYHSGSGSKAIVNNYGYKCGFMMTIYGPCASPTITIAGHQYKVNHTLEANEYMTIKSTDKEKYITVHENDGTITNQFGKRDKAQYIFEKIPNGNSSVFWDGTFGFDITLIDERSEPKWT